MRIFNRCAHHLARQRKCALKYVCQDFVYLFGEKAKALKLTITRSVLNSSPIKPTICLHTGEKPYDVCDKLFTKTGSLKTHTDKIFRPI